MHAQYYYINKMDNQANLYYDEMIQILQCCSKWYFHSLFSAGNIWIMFAVWNLWEYYYFFFLRGGTQMLLISGLAKPILYQYISLTTGRALPVLWVGEQGMPRTMINNSFTDYHNIMATGETLVFLLTQTNADHHFANCFLDFYKTSLLFKLHWNVFIRG